MLRWTQLAQHLPTTVTWIQTYSGKQFFPLDPRIDDIDIRDIAHALSLQCRFNGHCRTFYSVAEHSVRVSEHVPPRLARWGLLHDAAEAYLSDLPRPVKQQIESYVAMEERLLRLIAERFELSWPIPETVLEVDTRLLATEARDLMGAPPQPWDLDGLSPLSEPIEPWPAAKAEQRFSQRFEEL